MVRINFSTKQIYAGIAPIRNSITWSSNRKIVAFATLNDICFAKSECLENYTSEGIFETLPLKKKAACLAFAKSEIVSNKDTLLIIDSDGQLIVYDIIQNEDDNGKLSVNLIEVGEKSEYPSDFCQGHVTKHHVIQFWCRRNIIFCRKRGEAHLYQFKLKTDVKCFDSIIYGDSIFCVAGCVNGNVYFFETKIHDLSYFALMGLITPFPIPVLNVVLQQLDDMFICAFNHATKVTVIRWEKADSTSSSSDSSSSGEISSLKIRRQLQFSGKNWYMSTDSVISDFTIDIASLKFDSTGRRLLIVTNDRDFGAYQFETDPENLGSFTWTNIMTGGEAKERPYGYCGGYFTTSGSRIIIYTTRGGFMVFDLNKQGENFYLATEAPPLITGHTSAISGAEWDPTGKLLFTAGTRSREMHIIAPLKDGTFCQIARPESHQYDIQCFTPLSGLSMAVGSDELPFRIYKGSANYCTSIENLTGIQPKELVKHETEMPTVKFFKQTVLGVLNIAADDAEENEDEADSEAVFIDRPTTNQLLRFTFWEVAESLYGHSNPASALAVDSASQWIATSCHATTPEDAVIFVRKVNDWNIHSRLSAHHLTVTKLAFSPNSQYLLSVSRDRSLAIFNVDEDSASWEIKCQIAEAHTRMILACAWTPDSQFFVTGGRDAFLSLWPVGIETAENKVFSDKLGAPIMALDIAKQPLGDGQWLLAAGLGNGEVHFYSLSPKSEPKLLPLGILQNKDAFSLAITSLKFRPSPGEWGSEKPENSKYNLAVGSENGIVKVYSILAHT